MKQLLLGASLSFAVFAIATDSYGQSGPGPSPGGGTGTVTQVTCPGGTIVSAGTCPPMAANGTSGNVITATGSGNNLHDSGTPLSSLAPLASPVLTGTPTAPTQTAGDSSSDIATDAFVATAVGAGATSPYSICGHYLAYPLGVFTGDGTDPTDTISITGPSGTWMISEIILTNMVGTTTSVAGGFYAGIAGSGTTQPITPGQIHSSIWNKAINGSTWRLDGSSINLATTSGFLQHNVFTTSSQAMHLDIDTMVTGATVDIYVECEKLQ